MEFAQLRPSRLLDSWAVSLADNLAGSATTIDIRATDSGFVDRTGTPIATPIDAPSGCAVVCELDPRHVVFVELPVPPGAEDHVDGIVSSKLPQISPWQITSIAYGYHLRRAGHPPGNRGGVVLIAIVNERDLPPAATVAKGGSVSYCARTPAGERIGFRRTGTKGEPGRTAKVVAIKALLVALLFIGVGSLFASPILSFWSERQIAAVNQRLAELRTSMENRSAGGAGADDPARLVNEMLNRRASRLAVVAALARLLPDNVYLEQLMIEDEILNFTAVTDDAAMVLGLMAQSPVFRNAAFAGPTVRQAGTGLVRLQISAEIASDEEAAAALEKLLLAAVND